MSKFIYFLGCILVALTVALVFEVFKLQKLKAEHAALLISMQILEAENTKLVALSSNDTLLIEAIKQQEETTDEEIFKYLNENFKKRK